jgi:branched-chain amino acid transport system substrate-binding protein
MLVQRFFKSFARLSGVVFVCMSLAGCSREDPVEPAPVAVVGQSLNDVGSEQPTEPERKLLIGVVGPETGPEAQYGQSVYQGVLLAAQGLNDAGGIGGEKLEVVHFDNKGGQGRTRDIVQHFVDQKAMAIIAAPTGWATFAPTYLSNDSKTILISIGSRRKVARSGDYIFQMSLNDEIATAYMVEHAIREQGFTRLALVTASDYDYSLDVSALFKIALNSHDAELVFETDTYDTYTGQHDLRSATTKLLEVADSLDAIIFTGSASEAAELLQGLLKENVRLPLLGGEDLFSDEFLDAAGESAIGSLVYATYPNQSLLRTKDFISTYEVQYQTKPDRFSALAFDATTLVANAIAESDSRKSSVVRETLLASKLVDGVTGTSEFAAQGTSINVPLIYKVVAGQNIGRFALQN